MSRNGRTVILLRSSWQTVNIGDIAHTPGVLSVIEKHLPDVEVILWPRQLNMGVDAMLRRRFPKLRIVRDAGCKLSCVRDDDPTLAQAMAEADLLLHGSCARVQGQDGDLEFWYKKTGKPYGTYGVTVGAEIGDPEWKVNIPADLVDVLDRAAFVYTRETRSLQELKKLDLRCPHVDFVPDGTFALDLGDEAGAQSVLASAGLEPDKFICVVGRLRFTPYWDIFPHRRFDWAEVERRKAVNEQYAEKDHAKMRDVIVHWVRETGLKVLICPEMTYEVDTARPLLYDPLPADVKPYVEMLGRYWLTDEAASVYRQARAVISMECHSPIIANACGRPGFYLQQRHDTWKGQMYPDLGLGAWMFDIEKTPSEAIAAELMNVHREYDKARAMVAQASLQASRRFAETMQVIRSILYKE